MAHDSSRTRIPADTIAALLRTRIRGLQLMSGERLGSERELAAELGISRSDLRLALAKMEEEHEIVRKIGRSGGVVVSDGKIERSLNTRESLLQIARRQGWKLTSRVLDSGITTADAADTRLLELTGESPNVLTVSRLRMLNGKPLSLEETHLPALRFPQFLGHDLTGSFYDLFASGYGIHPKYVDETLELVEASAEQAELLGIEEASPLFKVHRVSRTGDGVPCERATDYYLPQKVRFTMHHSGYVRLSAVPKT